MKNKWLKLFYIGLAVITLAATAPACSLFGGNSSTTTGSTTTTSTSTATTSTTAVPIVEINRVAPNNLDLAGSTEAALATPGEGALVVNEAARIWVPPGSVANDTPVTLKVFIETPENLTSAATDGPEVMIVSNLYDLGPDNTEFSQPVTVTLSYDEADLPAGADENNIGPVYWNGENWIPLERQIDTEKNTISFETRSFPGVVLGTAFGFAVGWGTVTATGVAVVGAGAIIGYKTWKWWVKDPVYYGKAAEYVTPNDPTVQKYADMSTIKLIGSDTRFDIKDLQSNPNAIAALENNADADGYIGFIRFYDENGVEKPMTYNVSWNPNDWQKPADFFNNGMVGDCKNVANAVGSIVRYYGFPAKCMDGYTNGARHAWLEVKIGEKMYYVGSRGELMTLEGATKYLQLTRSVNKNGETFEWDESGQKPYKKNWWVDKIEVNVSTLLAFPGGKVNVEVFGAAGTAIDIALSVEAPDNTKVEYNGTTDAATGKANFTVPIKPDAPIGVYYARASIPDSDVSEMGIFSVDKLEIAAGMVAPQAAPGEDIGINVRLNYPLAAKIAIDGVSSSWTTEQDGTKTITLNIPETAKLGVYTLTIRAPEYGISTTVKYTVTVPPTLKVEIKNKEVAPGGTLDVSVAVLPPQVTRITVRGWDGIWSTTSDGLANPKLPVPATAKPGQYTVTVEAPQLELIESDSYTVTTTPSYEIGLADINVIAVHLTISVEGATDEAEYEARLVIGGQDVRSTTNGYQVYASATVDTAVGPGDIYYVFNLNKELTMVTSGSFSLVTDSGESYSFNFSNVPMSPDYEDRFMSEMGLKTMVFRVAGSEVMGHISSLSVHAEELGTISRYFADSESELLVILIAATDSQMTELLDEVM